MAFDGIARALLTGTAGFMQGRQQREEDEERRRKEKAQANLEAEARKREAKMDAVRARLLESQIAGNQADAQRSLNPPPRTRVETAADGTLYRIDENTGQAIPITRPDGRPVRGQVPQRNIDPLSEQGITAAERRAAAIARAQAPYRTTGAEQGQIPGKTLPPSVAAAIIDNQGQLATIQAAEDAVAANPSAVGVQRVGPDAFHNIIDPDGVAARSAVANIGSLVIKNRSGAAVSVHEMARMRPFIPTTSDPPGVVRSKLAELRRLISEETEALAAYYQQQGYATPGQMPDFSDVSGGSSSAADEFGDLELPGQR